MEYNDMRTRLIWLRKHKLRLTQREFCDRLSLSQQTYAPVESGRREIREIYLKSICSVFNVNEEWIRHGIEPIFNDIEQDRELYELLAIYDRLSPTLKKYLLGHAKQLLSLQGELGGKPTDASEE